jgi:hypothetical protein
MRVALGDIRSANQRAAEMIQKRAQTAEDAITLGSVFHFVLPLAEPRSA